MRSLRRVIRAALFDVDGTLVDSVDLHAQAWRRALAHFGVAASFDEVRAQIGKGGDQLLPVFLDRARLEKDGPRIEAFRGDLFRRELLPLVRPFPGVRSLLERVRRGGAQVVLASSAAAGELDHYARLCRVDDLIHAATSKDDAARSKPHPDIFAAALARVPGARPAEALIVGDSPWDVEAARRLGVGAVGVLCGGFAEADLRGRGAGWIYRDPEDLLARYDTSPFASRLG